MRFYYALPLASLQGQAISEMLGQDFVAQCLEDGAMHFSVAPQAYDGEYMQEDYELELPQAPADWQALGEMQIAFVMPREDFGDCEWGMAPQQAWLAPDGQMMVAE